MLRLRHQIGGNRRRMSALAGHHNLRRPRQHIDAAVECDQPLRRRDIQIAGPTILSTRGSDGVPYAIAAIACAPPTR